MGQRELCDWGWKNIKYKLQVTGGKNKLTWRWRECLVQPFLNLVCQQALDLFGLLGGVTFPGGTLFEFFGFWGFLQLRYRASFTVSALVEDFILGFQGFGFRSYLECITSQPLLLLLLWSGEDSLWDAGLNEKLVLTFCIFFKCRKFHLQVK